MSPANGGFTSLRQTEMAYLALFDQFLDRSCYVFDWNLGINPVLIQKINAIGSQTLKAQFN